MQTHYGGSNHFGHADWYAAQNRGMTPTQIANWLRANPYSHPKGRNSKVYQDVMAAEMRYNQQQAAQREQQRQIDADNAARQAAIQAQQQAQAEAEAARQRQAAENEAARQQQINEELKNQQHQQALADERAKTAEIAASNQNIGGGGTSGGSKAPSTQDNFGGFGDSFKQDPTARFSKFDGSNFMSASTRSERNSGTGWNNDSSLELSKRSRDPIQSTIKANSMLTNQTGTGKERASTEEMNSSLQSDAKERAQNWKVGYGKRF